MQNEANIVRFLTNQIIDVKGEKIKKKKRVFFDNRNWNKCSASNFNDQSFDQLKAIAQCFNNDHSKFKAFAILEKSIILGSGNKITPDPEDTCNFKSHVNIEYVQFEIEKDGHFPPDLDLMLEEMQKKAIYLIDESLDSLEFNGKEYKIDPEDVKSRKLIEVQK